MAGSNASEDAQGDGDGADEAGAVSGVDIVLNHQLVETGFGDKKGFTAYLKVKTFVKKTFCFAYTLGLSFFQPCLCMCKKCCQTLMNLFNTTLF